MAEPCPIQSTPLDCIKISVAAIKLLRLKKSNFLGSPHFYDLFFIAFPAILKRTFCFYTTFSNTIVACILSPPKNPFDPDEAVDIVCNLYPFDA